MPAEDVDRKGFRGSCLTHSRNAEESRVAGLYVGDPILACFRAKRLFQEFARDQSSRSHNRFTD